MHRPAGYAEHRVLEKHSLMLTYPKVHQNPQGKIAQLTSLIEHFGFDLSCLFGQPWETITLTFGWYKLHGNFRGLVLKAMKNELSPEERVDYVRLRKTLTERKGP